MARGRQPSPQQITDELKVTGLAATAALLEWDEYERQLLAHLEHQLIAEANLNGSARVEKSLQIVRRLARGNSIEDADHRELYSAVRGVVA